ncbi:MAG TPA: Kdo hydroxylase family protein [Candidatus Limnocylindrales bacterium]|nr:Kdo hydroxylase family protein [Candidatus Limnocylindrales bacterium]
MPSSPIVVEDYRQGSGWVRGEQREARARAYCELLERGQILFFREPPFRFPAADREFLLAQEWTDLRLHKNVSYRPTEDVLRGVAGDAATIQRVHDIFREYSRQVIGFLGEFLSPYAGRWTLDFASFRPIEEERRGLPLHKRNDLLHVDAFPSRPTRGGRILRVFTNLNPEKPRVWNTTEDFELLAKAHAERAGLRQFAEEDGFVSRTMQDWGAKLGFGGFGRTPYDMFMLRFHDYLKENRDFQQNCPKMRMEFPPLATWIVFTDCVAHAVLSGRFAIEQTILIPPSALVAPQVAPYKILESIAGRPLVS